MIVPGRPARRLRARLAVVTTLVVGAGSAALPGFAGAAAVAGLSKTPRTATTHTPSSPISVEIALAPRHRRELAALLASVTTPGSPSYHHFLAKGAFAARFGATTASVAQLRTYLRSAGLEDVTLTPNRLALVASGPARSVAHALGTRLLSTKGRSGSTVVTAAGLTLPRSLARQVLGALPATRGLQRPVGHPGRPVGRHRVARPHGVIAAPAPSAACAQSIASAYGSTGAGLTADQVANAYGVDPLYAKGDFGGGKSIALIEFSGYLPSDIATYAACYDITPAITTVPVDGGPHSAVRANIAEAEADIEIVLGLAPAANILVYEGPASGGSTSVASAYDVYAAAIDQDTAQVISTSWGECESDTTAAVMKMENVIFEQAALQGQSVVAASGDTGPEDCNGDSNKGESNALAVDDPGSQPFVTDVGGTTLTVAPSRQEVAWGRVRSAPYTGGSGGGVSTMWKAPRYQSATPRGLGVIRATHGSCRRSDRCRAVPDIAANAGTAYATYCTLGYSYCARGWTGFGGTSAASPTVASLFVLADASSACATTGGVGFANPSLYRAASGVAYPTALTDIVRGDTAFVGDHPRAFTARPGYDLATGLGSPIEGDGTDGGLVTQLCSPVVTAATVGYSGVPVPTVDGVTPSTVHAGRPTRLTITGRDFIDVSSVTIDGRAIAASDFTVTSPTTITAMVTTPPGRFHVTVTNREGSSAANHADLVESVR